MVKERMDLLELLRKGGMDGDVDFLREALRVLVEGIMDAEVSARTGAEYGERSPERVTQRNGYRSRAWDTRVGTMDLHIPKLREGSYFPSLLEPRRRSERALLAVIQQAYVEGVSTRRVDDLVKALGCEGISKSQVSRICQELDVVVDGFMGRPLDAGPYPYLWLDALTQKVREDGRIVNVSVVVATAVNGEGKREGLQVILERSEEFEVVGQARDGVEAVKAASELSPDLIVMDVMMPKKDGVEACREIMESLPDTRVIMLTASTEAIAVIEAVAAGATGYLQKVVGMDQVLGMMKGAAAGGGRLPTEVVRRVFDRIRRGAKSKEEVDLTLREKEILVSFCRGMSYVAIAEAREVKVVTIRNAIYTIQVKLGVASKQEVVVWAVRNGLSDD